MFASPFTTRFTTSHRTPVARALLAAAAVVLTLLAPTTPTRAAGAEAAAASEGPVRYRTIPTRVFEVAGVGAVAVGAPSRHRVMIQHLDPATGLWRDPEVLYQEPGIECGDLSGRTSAGGVALLLECDRFWAVDQAPTRSVALVSQDLRTWAQRTLPGEAYLPPGISPDGTNAVWLVAGHGDFVRWSAGSGFAPLQSTTFDYDSGDPTAVVGDDGTVTVLGAEPAPGPDRRCVIGTHSLTTTGEHTSAWVDPAPGHRLGCTELRLVNRSSTRVEGRFWSPADTFVLGRDDESSPWRLAAVSPSLAPGLRSYDGSRRRTMRTVFSGAGAESLVAVGSPDRQHLIAQLYDAEAQEWGPATEIYDHGLPGCAWDGSAGSAQDQVHHLLVHCYLRERADGQYPPFQGGQVAPRRRSRALLSHDGRTWLVVPLGGRPLGVGRGGSLVAAPQARRTTVVSPAGVVRLAHGAPGRCDAVFPTAPDDVVRLHAGRGDRGWPTRLQAHDGTRWRTVDRVRMPQRVRCDAAETGDAPTDFVFRGKRRWVYVRVTRTDEGWQAVRTRGY